MTKLKFIDLFAGLGGFHNALNELEREYVFTSEFDLKLREIFYEIYCVKPYGDISYKVNCLKLNSFLVFLLIPILIMIVYTKWYKYKVLRNKLLPKSAQQIHKKRFALQSSILKNPKINIKFMV